MCTPHLFLAASKEDEKAVSTAYIREERRGEERRCGVVWCWDKCRCTPAFILGTKHKMSWVLNLMIDRLEIRLTKRCALFPYTCPGTYMCMYKWAFGNFVGRGMFVYICWFYYLGFICKWVLAWVQ